MSHKTLTPLNRGYVSFPKMGSEVVRILSLLPNVIDLLV